VPKADEVYLAVPVYLLVFAMAERERITFGEKSSNGSKARIQKHLTLPSPQGEGRVQVRYVDRYLCINE